MVKPIVFISHITEEKEVALALKKVVETAFIGMMDVFVSSDPKSIHLGQEWLQKIKFALMNCAVEIIIASPASVKRQWINFEAGAGWIRNAPVIPLCHSGMIPDKLPTPLGTLQAATATDLEQLDRILPVLADALNSSVPKIDFTEFIETVREFEKDSRWSESLTAKNPLEEVDGLSPHELATFVTVAELSDVDDPIGVWQVKNELETQYRPIAVSLALKMLERKELVILSKEPGDGYNNREDYLAARVSDPGWVWLQNNQDMLVLTTTPKSPAAKAESPPDDEIPF